MKNTNKIFTLMLSSIIAVLVVACSKKDDIQIPNPWVSVKTIEQAQEKVGKDFNMPSYIPDGYKLYEIRIMNSDVVEINYKNGDNKIIYRVSTTPNSSDDISGDYNEYNVVLEKKIGNYNVILKRENDAYNLATWTYKDSSFSLSSTAPFTQNEIDKIIESINK